jgi:ABC-type sugar transport system permease subunit
VATTIFVGRESSQELSLHPSDKGRLASRERRIGTLFVSPWITGFLLLFLVPLVASLVMSFTNYELVEQDGQSTQFVGLDNWRRMFRDDDVRHSAWITLKFALVALPLSLFVPLGIAFLLTARNLKFRGLFRVLFYLPTMVPLVAATIVWKFYLNDRSGWLAKVLGWFGIGAPDFQNDVNWTMPRLWLIGLWGIGNAIIINIAALNSVPAQLYEAATLDGAGRWRLFRDVTWPMISPITFYNLIIALVGIGQYFVVPYSLNSGTGGPQNSNQFYTMVFYEKTFNSFQGGYGATLAWAMFAVVFILTAVLFWSARFWVHYEYEER